MTARSRVVDHWKRLAAILLGFAITVGAGRAYSCWLSDDWPSFAQFVILMVTIPPIFHGIERSLDLRYLRPDAEAPPTWRIILDTTTVVLTGLFLLALALSIPDHTQPNRRHDATMQNTFFYLFIAFFAIDALALLNAQRRFAQNDSHRSAHENLAYLNLGTAFLVALLLPFRPWVDWVVVAIAAVRTIADYSVTRDFLFPSDAPVSGGAPIDTRPLVAQLDEVAERIERIVATRDRP